MPDEEDRPQLPAPEAEHLRAFLRDRDAMCPICDYNLRDLASSTCPECGTTLQLAVGPLAPPSSAWVVLLMALCIPASLGVLTSCLCWGSGPDIFAWVPDGQGAVSGLVAAYCMACLPLTVVALCTRSRFDRFAENTQWALALIMSFASGVSFVMFGLMLSTM